MERWRGNVISHISELTSITVHYSLIGAGFLLNVFPWTLYLPFPLSNIGKAMSLSVESLKHHTTRVQCLSCITGSASATRAVQDNGINCCITASATLNCFTPGEKSISFPIQHSAALDNTWAPLGVISIYPDHEDIGMASGIGLLIQFIQHIVEIAEFPWDRS